MFTDSPDGFAGDPSVTAEGDSAESGVEEARGATAPTEAERIPVDVSYTKKESDKDKRKSFFGFLSKLGGKKKHRKSTENLLAIDEGEGVGSKVNKDVPITDHGDEEDGVVPLEMQRDIEGNLPMHKKILNNIIC